MTTAIPVLLACELLILFSVSRSRLIARGSVVFGLLAWIGVIVATSGALYIVLVKATPWNLQRANPFTVDASMPSSSYETGRIVAGIPWKKEYRELRVYVRNGSDGFSMDQVDLSLDLGAVNIFGAGQNGGTSNCILSPSGDLGPFVIDPRSVQLRDKNGVSTPVTLISSKYSVHCDHIGEASEVPLTLAVSAIPYRVTVLTQYDLVDGDKRIRKSTETKQQVRSF